MTRHSDLLDTWLRLPSPDLATLRQYGVSFRAAQLVGGVRSGSNPSLLIPAWLDPPSIYHVVDDPVLRGIVRIDPEFPDKWKCDAGVAMLGECMLREAIWFNEPLPVFRNPLTWLRSGGAGVFPLDWPAFINEILWASVELVAEDVAHGELIQRHLDTALKAGKPKVSVWRAAA